MPKFPAVVYLFIYLLFYVAFNSQGHIATGSLRVEETSAHCTVNHRASASNDQLSNMKRPARDSNRRPQRLEASTLTTTPPSPLWSTYNTCVSNAFYDTLTSSGDKFKEKKSWCSFPVRIEFLNKYYSSVQFELAIKEICCVIFIHLFYFERSISVQFEFSAVRMGHKNKYIYVFSVSADCFSI